MPFYEDASFSLSASSANAGSTRFRFTKATPRAASTRMSSSTVRLLDAID